MSYNGSGTFNINTAGQPVVTGTVISSTAFNALTADLGTGLSTALTKDGQTVATARIPFAQGINSSLVTDATSTTTGSIITAGGVGIAKALYVGTTLNVTGASTLAGITGTFNGTVGATTPSTGAFTTLNLSSTSTISGTMTFRAYNPGWVISPTVGTNSAYGQYVNTGGSTYVGIDNSTGGDFGGAAGNYGFNIYRPSVGFAISRAGVVDIGITSAGAVSIPGTLAAGATTVTGTLSATTGAAVGGATAGAGGLAFPATAVAVTDVNTLDDYEEGTFLPTVYGGTTAGTTTYAAQRSGYYTKIGRMIFFQFYVKWTAQTGTGDMFFGGFPAGDSLTYSYGSLAIGYIDNIALTAGKVPMVYLSTGATPTAYLYQTPTGGGAAAAVPIDSAGEIMFSGFYMGP